jgi:hypothetical protein
MARRRNHREGAPAERVRVVDVKEAPIDVFQQAADKSDEKFDLTEDQRAFIAKRRQDR